MTRHHSHALRLTCSDYGQKARGGRLIHDPTRRRGKRAKRDRPLFGRSRCRVSPACHLADAHDKIRGLTRSFCAASDRIVQQALTPQMVADAKHELSVTLANDMLDLQRVQNGGLVADEWSRDHVAVAFG